MQKSKSEHWVFFRYPDTKWLNKIITVDAVTKKSARRMAMVQHKKESPQDRTKYWVTVARNEGVAEEN